MVLSFEHRIAHLHFIELRFAGRAEAFPAGQGLQLPFAAATQLGHVGGAMPASQALLSGCELGLQL